MSACGIEPHARAAFEARIRQLQRLGLPRRTGAGPVGRIEYGIAELAALATAVRLMAAFMVPSLAARYVAERWEILAPVFLAGARAALPASYLARRAIGDVTMFLIDATALADLGKQGRHDERYAGLLGDVIAVAPAALEDAIRRAGGAGLILDATGYMPTIVEGFARGTIATEQELAHELDGLRFHS